MRMTHIRKQVCIFILGLVMTLGGLTTPAFAVQIGYNLFGNGVSGTGGEISMTGMLTFDTESRQVTEYMINFVGDFSLDSNNPDIIELVNTDNTLQFEITEGPGGEESTFRFILETDPITNTFDSEFAFDAQLEEMFEGQVGLTLVSDGQGTFKQAPIPEPGTVLLLSTGLLGLAGYRWHQRRRERIHMG